MTWFCHQTYFKRPSIHWIERETKYPLQLGVFELAQLINLACFSAARYLNHYRPEAFGLSRWSHSCSCVAVASNLAFCILRESFSHLKQRTKNLGDLTTCGNNAVVLPNRFFSVFFGMFKRYIRRDMNFSRHLYVHNYELLLTFLQCFTNGDPKNPNNWNLYVVSPELTFSDATICRYWVHTVKRYVFLLSSPPTQIHRNTFLELSFQKPFISSLPSPAKQCIQQHVRGRSLAAPSPLGLYPASVLEEWLNRPPTSKWLELSNGEGSGVSGGQDANAAQSRSQTEHYCSHRCDWVMKAMLRSCWCF